MEVARHVDRIMHQHVELLGAEHDAGDAADEAEEHQRQEHAGEGRMAPRRLAQPFEHAAIIAVLALRRFDRSRHGQAVNHRAEHGQIHHVAGVDDLPARIQRPARPADGAPRRAAGTGCT